MIDPDGKWRLYRSAMDGATFLHTSADGIHWSEDAHHIPGSLCAVFHDPKSTDPSRRWKATEYRGGLTTSGIHFHYSPDGIHWTVNPERTIAGTGRAPKDPSDGWPYFGIDDASHVYYDHKLDKYVASFKTWNFDAGGRGDPEYVHTRIRAMAFSDDHIHWERPFVSLNFDEHDPDGFQFYDSMHFPYESMWLGLVRTLDAKTGLMDFQLVSSRDGRIWERAAGRQVFLPTGPQGSFDGGNLDHAFSPPVRVGDELYIYYTGSELGHLGYGGWEGKPDRKSGIGLARLRADGFVSLDADDDEGVLVTRPLNAEGRILHVNVDAVKGELRVELVGAAGNTIPGYSEDECISIRGDGVDHVVAWKTRAELPALTGGPYRLKFYLQQASLYSFRISDEGSTR
jgi:hypothetical protein